MALLSRNKMIKSFSYWIRICWIAVRSLFEERYTYHASALAFTTLLALVPLLSVIVSVASIFPVFTKIVDLARNYILTNFIPTSRITIEFYLQNFIQQATHLSTIGIIFLFIITGMLIVTVDQTFNEIWQTPKNKKRYSSWLLYWIILLFLPLLIGLSVFVSSYLFSISWFSGIAGALGIEPLLLGCLPFLINTLIFSIVYIIIPRYRVKWRDGFSGGFIAAILFEISKYGFAVYLRLFPSYELIYGTLATIPIFLLWVYIAWLIILYGALVTHTQFKMRQQK